LIDANGIIKVSATDKGTGKSHDSYRSFFWINSRRNRKMKKIEANADADKVSRERAEKLNEADGMIFQTETQLKVGENYLMKTK
jgi:molecular chaperone DnaK